MFYISNHILNQIYLFTLKQSGVFHYFDLFLRFGVGNHSQYFIIIYTKIIENVFNYYVCTLNVFKTASSSELFNFSGNFDDDIMQFRKFVFIQLLFLIESNRSNSNFVNFQPDFLYQ